MIWRSLALILTVLLAPPAMALPDLNQPHQAGGLVLLGDDTNPALFHFLPAGVVPVIAADGGPELTFTLARYVGTRLLGDSGTADIFSTLRLNVVLQEPDPKQMELARVALGRNAEFRPLALSQVDATLITGLEPIPAISSHSEAPSNWQNREIVLRYAPAEAELIGNLLRDGGTGVTLVWTVHAELAATANAETTILTTTIGEAVEEPPLSGEELADILGEVLADLPDNISTRPVAAGAIPISLTADQKPSRLTQYDINEVLPAAYPMLTIFCFAFQRADNDIIERLMEIEATSVLGLPTRASTYFAVDRPDSTAQSVKFTYAADLNAPYKWRVIDLLASGEERISEWESEPYWRAIIDITNPFQEDTE